uniref:pumilio homolog 2-like isoform X2 n=1 Tax=Ciona intestinalis TaxID=7719 RepID=UPI00089DB8BA|nr:pumilio homolog 2-like isoform X2 [Ciona intestinalis]|eukprot:XP_018670299.1 pumilio homolog 2-like isoform X2 [Ciona intestinalis]
MQRPNNGGGGGPGSGLWNVQDINMGSASKPFVGQSYRYVNPNQPPPHYKTGWGQSDQEAMAQQHAVWQNDNNSSQNTSDQSRSFLGTEQWGRESGGPTWGTNTTAATEQNTVTSARPPEQGVFTRHNVSDSWLSSRKSPVYQSMPVEAAGQEEKTLEAEESSQSPVEGVHDRSDKENSGPSRDNSPDEGAKEFKDKSRSPSPKDEIENETEENTEAAADAPDEPSAVTPDDAEGVSPEASSFQGETPSVSAEEVTDQMQQMSLVDSYMAAQQQQQQTIAAHLSGYQLAMQQQYALATPGMFLPSSYIIPAQANAQGYTDPNTQSQVPLMAPYNPYAGWPTAGMYPTMLQQQVAAMTAAQGSAPATSHPNRALSETPQSRPLSPSSIPQQDGPPAQSEILANMAAMQQSNLNQAMAMAAAYPMIPSAYYDQTGALIINNSRTGGPVRLFAPGPMFMNGSQHPLMAPPIAGANGSMFRYNQASQQQAATAVYANQQNLSGGSTPLPSISQGYNPNIQQSGPFGSTSNISSLGIGALGAGIGSASSTPQRRDSFSDYPKQYGGVSQFYSSLGVSPGSGGVGAMSPSPGPLSNMMGHSHHNLNTPPPSMSSPSGNLLLGGNGNRMFSAAPGAEAKYRNGPPMSQSIFGSSGSSLFPPTRIQPPNSKVLLPPTGRSKLLDDFRNNRLTNPHLHELVGHIVEFSQDQHGSRFIQQKLERATPQEKQLVFNEIIGAAYQLMTDVFGNYVIQKFFEFGSLEHKLALANCIHGHVLPLALQMYGCRVIQKALECIPQEQQVEIVKELDGHLLKCVKDQNGNHVVQKCIECVPPAQLQFIVDGFKGQVVGLSSHPYGCRVMQRILEHCNEDQTGPILEELHQHSEMLVKDQYGNYVIQHILEHGRTENKNQIINELRGRILTLSQHKFASNVIEKCVSHSSPQTRAWLIDEVCQEPDALFIMMKDQYANYVVQKMLDVADPQQKKLLIHKIRPHILTLRKFTYGKHIITKLEKFFLRSSGNSPGPSLNTGPAAEISQSQIATSNWVHNAGSE